MATIPRRVWQILYYGIHIAADVEIAKYIYNTYTMTYSRYVNPSICTNLAAKKLQNTPLQSACCRRCFEAVVPFDADVIVTHAHSINSDVSLMKMVR